MKQALDLDGVSSEDSFLENLRQEELFTAFRAPEEKDVDDDRGFDYLPEELEKKDQVFLSSLPMRKTRRKNTFKSHLPTDKTGWTKHVKEKQTLHLRLEGQAATIRELERKVHEKEGLIIHWKQQALQKTRQAKAAVRLSQRPSGLVRPSSRVAQATAAREHREAQAQLQQQIEQLEDEFASSKQRQARLRELNTQYRSRIHELEHQTQCQEKTIRLQEDTIYALRVKIRAQKQQFQGYRESFGPSVSAANLVNELKLLNEEQTQHVKNSKVFRHHLRRSRTKETYAVEHESDIESDEANDNESISALDLLETGVLSPAPAARSNSSIRESSERMKRIRAMYDRIARRGMATIT